MNSHSSPDSHFDTSLFYENLLILDVDENLLEEEKEDKLAGRMIGAGFDTFDDMITQVRLADLAQMCGLSLCLSAALMVSCCLQARRKEVKKRRLGSVRMYLSSGLGTENQIALSIYKTVSE